MEEKKAGTINVRIPSDKVEELEKLCFAFGLTKSQLVKYAFQRFLEMVEETPPSERETLARDILRISEGMKSERPTRYRTRKSKGMMLVAEEPDNSWKAPKKRGRKKKSDQPPKDDESSPKSKGK